MNQGMKTSILINDCAASPVRLYAENLDPCAMVHRIYPYIPYLVFVVSDSKLARRTRWRVKGHLSACADAHARAVLIVRTRTLRRQTMQACTELLVLLKNGFYTCRLAKVQCAHA